LVTSGVIRSSLFTAEQSDTLKLPIHYRSHILRQLLSRLSISLDERSEDQVPIVTLGILVHGARVFTCICILFGRWLLFSCWVGTNSSNVDDGEGIELRFVAFLFELLFTLLPGATLEIKSMNENSLCHWVNLFAFNAAVIARDNFLLHGGFEVYLVKRPHVSLVLTSDLLLHRGQETLGIGEAGHPERWRAFLVQPIEQLVMSINETLQPGSETWSHPGDFNTGWVELPLLGHSEVSNRIDAVN